MDKARKSFLEVFLTPVVVAVVGGIFTLTVSENQKAAIKSRTESEREVKLLEIFSDKIFSEDESAQKLAIELLSALDDELRAAVASAVESSTKDEGLKALAAKEKDQAIRNIMAAGGEYCEEFSSMGAAEWAKTYVRPVKKDTWHVIVSSLGRSSTKEVAIREARRLERLFPGLSFEPLATASGEDGGNEQYAIVVASGLSVKSEASAIAEFARRCGISKGAFAYKQDF